MKQIVIALLTLCGLTNCNRHIDLVGTTSNNPATLADASTFAKKYQVRFEPDANFNSDKKISKDSLEKMFVKWSNHQTRLLSPEQRETAKIHDAFYAEASKTKSRKEYYKVLDKYPSVKAELMERMGGVEKFNEVKEMTLKQEAQAK